MPDNSTLNRWMAEALGWKVVAIEGWENPHYQFDLYSPSGAWIDAAATEEAAWLGIPDFCEDRNALPEVLEAVVRAGESGAFSEALGYPTTALKTLLIPCRQHVIAALKALDKLPDGWDSEE